MDDDTEVELDLQGNKVTDEVRETLVKWTPENDTLIGIYQCAYSTDTAVRKVANFIDRIDWYFELLYYALIGAMIGWAIAKILLLLGLF